MTEISVKILNRENTGDMPGGRGGCSSSTILYIAENGSQLK